MLPEIAPRLKALVNRQRIIDTLTELVAIPSRTGEAGAVLDAIAQLLQRDGFTVERPIGGHPQAPAVAVRLDSGQPGKTLQFNGHVDVVHLPFVPPGVDGGNMTGSGSVDMKGGTVAAIEALRVLRESGALTGGSVLFTAHDLHEAPWGFGQQLNQMIKDGYVGDAVLIPEYLNHCIPTIGRGSATWKIQVRRNGPPVHEVMRPTDEPSVIDAGAELVARFRQLGQVLAARIDPQAGCETVFIGQIHSGEIFNQYPQECWLEGTRRWLPGRTPEEVETEFRGLVAQVAKKTGTTIEVQFQVIRDAFKLETGHPFVEKFQQALVAAGAEPLPLGSKMFVDDCNTFWSLAGIPSITHGPTGGGAHTIKEWVSIDDLVRVAHVYALTAVNYCPA